MADSAGPGPLDDLSGQCTLMWLVAQSPVAELYAGLDRAGVPVSVLMLTAPAAIDPQLRAAFAAAVGNSGFAPGAGDLPIHAAELSGPRPWAVTYQQPGQPGAERLVAGLPGGPLVATTPGGPLTASLSGGTPLAVPGVPASPATPGAAANWSSKAGRPPAPLRFADLPTRLKASAVTIGLVLFLTFFMLVYTIVTS